MIKILGKKIFLLLFTSLAIYAGSIESSVDSTEIVKGDSVLFSLTIIGEKSDPLPELKDIDGMKIERITRSNKSDFVHINGKSVMQNTTTITYEFKPKYNMTIPAFQVMVDGKIEISKAINLKVVESKEGIKPKNKYFSLEMKLDKNRVYLGEPVIATIYFRQNKNINLMELKYKKPPFLAFYSKQLDGETTYKDGIYIVHELKYLLIPKKEGNITIQPATAKVSQRVQERQEGGWFANVPKMSNISSTPLKLEVLRPAFSDYDLAGSFTLTSSIDKRVVQANKPVNLTIELKGEGSLEEFEGIDIDLPDVTVYSDDANITSSYKKGKITSHYVKSFAFISDHDFTIPTKSIKLFDYTTGRLKYLKTKSYNIKVRGGLTSKDEHIGVVHTKNGEKILSNIEKTSILNKFKNLSPSILLLSLTFLLGALSSFFVLYIVKYFTARTKAKKQAFNGHEALQILYPHMRESPEVEFMVRQLYAIKNGERKIKIDRELLRELLRKYKSKDESKS